MTVINPGHDEGTELRIVGVSTRSDIRDAFVLHTNRQATLEEADALRRAILAARPEVTREAVEKWIREKCPVGSLAFKILAALSHFAPPREVRPIDGMSVEEIAAMFREELTYRDSITATCARVAHRLAQPVPKVDPDAEAKRLAWEHVEACGLAGQYTNQSQFWETRYEPTRAFWRRIAAKEAGRE